MAVKRCRHHALTVESWRRGCADGGWHYDAVQDRRAMADAAIDLGLHDSARTIDGGDEVISFQVTIKGDDRKEIRRYIISLAFGVEAAIKLGGTGPKTGATYTRRGGVSHTASAPGESPASDTGFLYGSITVDIKSDSEAEIIIPAEYAEALEFGTFKMAARPFILPAIDSVLKRFDSGGLLGVLRD